MPDPELVLRFVDRNTLLTEHAQNLSQGRAFVPLACELSVFSPCTLRLVHPELDLELTLPCEVVMVMAEGQLRGTALQFLDRSEQTLASVHAFVTAQATAEEPTAEDDDESEPYEPSADSLPPASEAQRAVVEARAHKLRNLTPAERMQVARGSVLDDRVLLERIYGSAVWELLLRNPKVTVPEVARMARKGTMPRPLLEVIADNEQWIRHSLVRRALLANPRLSSDGVNRVLRTLPPRELRLVPQQTAYPPLVRQAASRLMRG